MENNQRKWEVTLSSINWGLVDKEEFEKFNSTFKEVSEATNVNSKLNETYRTRVSVLFLTMILTLIMNYLNFSNRSIIISTIICQLVFTAFYGISSWGSGLWLAQANDNMSMILKKINLKYPVKGSDSENEHR